MAEDAASQDGAFRSDRTAAQRSVFDSPEQRERCFERTYTESHLKQHPKQTVKRIEAKLVSFRDETTGDVVHQTTLTFVQRDSSPTELVAQCTERNGTGAECKAINPCDGSRFVLSRPSEVELRVTNRGIKVAGSCDSAAQLSAEAKADDVFDLLSCDHR